MVGLEHSNSSMVAHPLPKTSHRQMNNAHKFEQNLIYHYNCFDSKFRGSVMKTYVVYNGYK